VDPKKESTEVQRLRKKVESGKSYLKFLDRVLDETRVLQEVDDWALQQLEAQGLGPDGQLCQMLSEVVKTTWDLHDEIIALRNHSYPDTYDAMVSCLCAPVGWRLPVA
jgi:hypothetical protein